MHEWYVEVDIDFNHDKGGGAKGCAATVMGSDLTSEYVSVNADFRS